MLEVLAEGPDLKVYAKPSGVSLLADRAGAPNLWDEFKALGKKPYLVHRLDKGTSGVLLVAYSQRAQRTLTKRFADRDVTKFYVAWVNGLFPAGRTYELDLPMTKGRKSRYRLAGPREAIQLNGSRYSLAADREGVDARTYVRVLRTTEERSLVLLKPITGRTHQLRVQMAWLGFPLLGDHLYGRPDDPAQQADRLMLHCHCLSVPGWGTFRAPLPGAFLSG